MAMKRIGDERLIAAAMGAAGPFIAVITPRRRILSAAGPAVPEAGGATGKKTCFEVFYGLKSPCERCGLDMALEGNSSVMTPRGDTAQNGAADEYNHIYPLPTDDGDGNWVCAAISTRTAAAKKTDLSVAFLSKLIHSAADGVISADMSGRIRIFNDAAATLFGYSAREVLDGKNIRDLYPPKTAYEIMSQMRSDRFGGKGRLNAYRVFVLNKSGDRIPIRLNASIIYEDGREIATIGFFRDLREEIRLQSRLAARTKEDPGSGLGEDVSLGEILEGFTVQMAAYDSRFGAVAVAAGLVTGDQMDQALVKQQEIIEKTKIHIPIGRVMIQMGLLTEQQREGLLNVQKATAAARDGADTAPERTETVPGEAAADGPFTIRVTEDAMTAILEVDHPARGAVTADAVMARLAQEGIHPLETAPADIAAFLAAGNAEETSLVVARGAAPVPGTPPEITFHFDTDPLKAGTERSDGTIDWKDRGSLPQVKAGDILATVTPGTPGPPGKDVYGTEIPDSPPPGLIPTCGKGVAPAEDGLGFYATRQGMAQISAEGVLDILETLTIDGDIGLDTGHVDFDGHIEVKGSIQDGFRVTGGSLRVADIHRAEVTLSGDLVVTGGIYDAVVRCAGGVKASHIHKSRVDAGKDLTVDREIIDSQVETDGKCVTSTGAIISSEVTAKMGIVARDIGTEASKPSTLAVGVDLRLQRQIQSARKKTGLLKKEKARLSKDWEALSVKSDRNSTELGEKAQQQDKCMVQIRELTAERDALPVTGEKARRKMLEKQIQMTIRKKENLDAQVEALLEKDESLGSNVSRMSADIAGLEEDLRHQDRELTALMEASKTSRGVPTVKASGKIVAGTVISGPNASLTTQEELNHVLVLETNKPDADGERRWRMITQPLR